MYFRKAKLCSALSRGCLCSRMSRPAGEGAHTGEERSVSQPCTQHGHCQDAEAVLSCSVQPPAYSQHHGVTLTGEQGRQQLQAWASYTRPAVHEARVVPPASGVSQLHFRDCFATPCNVLVDSVSMSYVRISALEDQPSPGKGQRGSISINLFIYMSIPLPIHLSILPSAHPSI